MAGNEPAYWPLAADPRNWFVAGKTVGEWEAELGEDFDLSHPWDLLDLNVRLLESLVETPDHGAQMGDGAVLSVGEGTQILPGVYVEGRVMIGRDCKIGPNCYLRGSTTIGDGCHIGQAVEVKNSIIGHGSSAGHLTYLGDSVLGERVNLGAGTISSNLRHDGGNHRSMVNGELVDTGRRKMGVVLGDEVHTGIHTSFYPGRKLGPKATTLPGAIVDRDLS